VSVYEYGEGARAVKTTRSSLYGPRPRGGKSWIPKAQAAPKISKGANRAGARSIAVIYERHEYELYLAIEDIDHSRTKTKSPQTNSIVERFHKTLLNECIESRSFNGV
jgi:transposase InsO family protein